MHEVIEPFDLMAEIAELEAQNISFANRLFIDERAGVVLPLHKDLDAGSENSSGAHKIGLRSGVLADLFRYGRQSRNTLGRFTISGVASQQATTYIAIIK